MTRTNIHHDDFHEAQDGGANRVLPTTTKDLTMPGLHLTVILGARGPS
jgi:hypothetical protein